MICDCHHHRHVMSQKKIAFFSLTLFISQDMFFFRWRGLFLVWQCWIVFWYCSVWHMSCECLLVIFEDFWNADCLEEFQDSNTYCDFDSEFCGLFSILKCMAVVLWDFLLSDAFRNLQ